MTKVRKIWYHKILYSRSNLVWLRSLMVLIDFEDLRRQVWKSKRYENNPNTDLAYSDSEKRRWIHCNLSVKNLAKFPFIGPSIPKHSSMNAICLLLDWSKGIYLRKEKSSQQAADLVKCAVERMWSELFSMSWKIMMRLILLTMAQVTILMTLDWLVWHIRILSRFRYILWAISLEST